MNIDIHVHAIGNGKGGSGCRLNVKKPYHKLLARYILYLFNIKGSTDHPDLDNLYINSILSMVKNSSLDKAVLLAHEQTYDDQGRALPDFGSMYVPNEYVLSLSKQHPEFLAGVSIHPGRKDAMDELDKCIEGGAVLMKCLPNCQNMDFSRKEYIPFWEKMSAAGLPLLVHTGGELSLPVYNKKFQDPVYLESPLKCGVKVIAAHCGTSSLPFETDYLDKFLLMLDQYPNLYGDSSGMQTPFRSVHFKKIINHKYASRVLHGSDVPIPVSGFWAKLRGLISSEQYKASQSDKNILSRDFNLKKAMGFPEQSFTQAATVLRLRS